MGHFSDLHGVISFFTVFHLPPARICVGSDAHSLSQPVSIFCAFNRPTTKFQGVCHSLAFGSMDDLIYKELVHFLKKAE